MQIKIANQEQHYQVKISGEITIFEAKILYEECVRFVTNAQCIECDLSEVSEIDSAGLQVLVALKKYAIEKKFNFSLINHSESVQALLDLSQLVNFFGDPVLIKSNATI